ncbi:hypothetical protein M6G65_06970 [Methylobacterium tardum]|uniref:hypothetical protein n=1 Tax=Methylobacterium tardum TaxID=374432 RepID=UPI002020B4D0|nr:hypothetical protein [Methylobacterium tardum]URD38195.1 hypothetical protein M6G65_06970 [Methylobacterium tardum]
MTQTTTWPSFLEKALWGLRRASEHLGDPEVQAEFEAADDWWRKPKTIGGVENVLVPEETAVSGALKVLFSRIQSDQVISGTPPDEDDLRQFHFSLEERRPRDPAIGKKTKPTDIAIVLRAAEVFDLRIEAKTLIEYGDIRSEYLSGRGLLRFEDPGNPYTLEVYGGMLAYIVKEEASVWEDRVRVDLLTQLGAERILQTTVGQRSMTTSTHRFDIAEKGKTRTVNVAVLHLVTAIEARPSLRNPTDPRQSEPNDA